MAELRKKLVKAKRFWKINAIRPVIKARRGKNGVVPVMGRVTINGTQSQFSCKKTIPLDMWDVKGNCAKCRSKEALQINR